MYVCCLLRTYVDLGSVSYSSLRRSREVYWCHYNDVLMGAIASQITSLAIVYSIVYSKKTSKFRVTGLCTGNSPWPVNSPHKWPVMRKMFPFDDVIMWCTQRSYKPNQTKSDGFRNSRHPVVYWLNAIVLTGSGLINSLLLLPRKEVLHQQWLMKVVVGG